MKKIFLLFLGLSSFLMSAQQEKLNETLKKELKDIYYWDQIYREYFDNSISAKRKSEIKNELFKKGVDTTKMTWALAVEKDSANMTRVEKIIAEYGYPGKTMVGEPENKTVWFVIQHSKKIGKYLPLIKEAGKKNEIPFRQVATMEDRYLMDQGKEQIYGTQGYGSFWNENGKDYKTEYIWPIKDPENVNKIRKEAGFTKTVEEYAKDIYGKDFVYKIYTLDDVKNGKIEIKEDKRQRH
ncbi:DUF6624 domain-containing protein [Chryseobacterium sp.]|uniref:DUF6624 domain-containing protein n=1 Tax=Chryseobacterium sp. TaxID=1871047 RepID=UPI00289D0214|nr:DUF6624 domain-containing protein [Chryseobacterium sp.]